jgi:outer membrane protein TolC
VVKGIPRPNFAAVALLALIVSTGCTPEAYKAQADAQVNRILQDRKKLTLDYTPQTDAAATVDPKPAKQAYSKIPTTPLPPPAPPAMSPTRVQVPYGPLGPELLFPPGEVSPRHDLLEPDVARAPAMERLKLGPPTAIPPGNVMDLFGALEFAVQHSREYSTRMEDTYLAALDVTLERHLFEPRPFARTSVNFNGGQLDANYRSAYTVTQTAGVRQQLPYGGEIIAQGLVDFVNAISETSNDGESAQVALSGSIPLLRGAGLVNLEPLVNSERQLVYEIRRFENFRRSFVVQIASQYFRLLSLQSSIANRRYNYVVLANLTEQTNALYDAGRINYLQVQRALQSQLQAENSLIDAQDAYQNALDNFKVTLGMAVEEPLEVAAIALDVTTPNLESDATALALQYRLDLQTSRDQIDDARRRVEVAKNGLLPDLDLTAQGNIGNRAGTDARQIDSRSLNYSAGMSFDWPLDRVSERNAYRSSLISLERAQRNFVETRDLIVAAVRDAVRNIHSAQVTLEIQRRAVELAQRRLDFSNELLIQGRASDSRDVVEAQNSLLSAQDAYDRAKADLQIQILQFLRDTGTLRVDPSAGALGHALDRAALKQQDEPTTQPLR